MIRQLMSIGAAVALTSGAMAITINPEWSISRVLPGPSGEILVTTTFENYRAFDGLKFAGKIAQKVMETEQVTTLLKVDRNGVADSKFALPKGITGLLAARGRGTATR